MKLQPAKLQKAWCHHFHNWHLALPGFDCVSNSVIESVIRRTKSESEYFRFAQDWFVSERCDLVNLYSSLKLNDHPVPLDAA